MAGWGGVGPWRAAGPAPGQAGDRPFKGGAWGQEVVWVGGGWVARRWGSLAVQPCWHGMAWGVGAPMLAIPPSWPPPPPPLPAVHGALPPLWRPLQAVLPH